MALVATPDQAFSQLLSRLELDATRVDKASTRYNAIKSTIENALPGCKVTQIGSFQRKTKIRSAALVGRLDIDAVVNLGRVQDFTDAFLPSDALKLVRRALNQNKVYFGMNPKPDAPTVSMKYADNTKVELVPALSFDIADRSTPTCYIVGANSRCWMYADYDHDAAWITAGNQGSGGMLVPSIKIVKALLRYRQIPLKSFHIEVLCRHIIPALVQEWTTQGYTFGYKYVVAQFLLSAQELLNAPVRIPGSLTPPQDSGKSAAELYKIGLVLQKLGERAWKICDTQHSPKEAAMWASFFGKPFSPYRSP